MNLKQYIFLSSAFLFSLSSCNDENSFQKEFTPQTYQVSGKVEKGPFISGSTVTIQPMDEKLQVKDNLYSTIIQDNQGNFTFGSNLFDAPYAELTANGYFFNEVNGKLSSGTLNLRALVDLSDHQTINVNLLTHLKYQRIQKLITNGLKFKAANAQAQKELFAAFGLQKYATNDASTFSIIKGTDESATIIAVSALLLLNRTEAAFTEYITKLSMEFSEHGKFTEQSVLQIKKDKKLLCQQLKSVKQNIINRYAELGISVEVKDLQHFIDWDEDGTAGNEILQNGQAVKIETPEIIVPNKGGIYTIKITSPIPVYLTPILNAADTTNDHIIEENYFDNLYEQTNENGVSIEKSLNKNTLTVRVSPLNATKTSITSIALYDYLGNIVGEVKITQEGNGQTTIPKLGQTGTQIVNRIASSLAIGFCNFNLIEQYYHYNKDANLVNRFIHPGSDMINTCWNHFYGANQYIMTLKEADAKRQNVYQHHLNVWSAMQYYYMSLAWNGVPYVNSVANEGMFMPRTPISEIFTDLKKNLTQAITNLEEKKNESLQDINDLFFVSKDVARILLAKIYMHEGNYTDAKALLHQVMSNGFYKLDTSNYNKQETITNIYNKRYCTEVIFAMRNSISPRTGITVATPLLVPMMNYTDVVLSYAECLCHTLNSVESEKQLNEVILAKNITVTGNSTLEKIKDARLQLMLYTNTNFEFMKRNGFIKDVYGIEDYQQILPIPEQEIMRNPTMTQNPNY